MTHKIDNCRSSAGSPDPGAQGSSADCEAAERLSAPVSVQHIWRMLEEVTDPEIPVLNVVEMGIIADVRIAPDGYEVDVTPTFAGCPAIAVICEDIRRCLYRAGATEIRVNVVYDPPWTSERMTAEGRRKLKEFGLAPPGPRCAGGSPILDSVPCPFCNSTQTDLESIFGPTLCRSIHYCRSCLQSFEHFKPI